MGVRDSIEGALIPVVGTISALHRSKPTVFHAGFNGEVYHRLVFAVVDTGHSSEIALAVNHLQLLDHLNREVFRCHFRIITEKFFAIEQDFAHSLAIGSDGTVVGHLNARQSLEEVFNHGVGLCFVSTGIVFHRVFHHLYRSSDTRHHDLAEGYATFAEAYGVEFHIRALDYDVALSRLIAYVAYFNDVFAVLYICQREESIEIGGDTADVSGVFCGLDESDRRLR